MTLPPFYIPTKYPGYFFNEKDSCLYSVKSGNELRKLRRYNPNKFNRLPMPGYIVSVEGKRRWLLIDYLKSLTIFNILKNTSFTKRKKK